MEAQLHILKHHEEMPKKKAPSNGALYLLCLDMQFFIVKKLTRRHPILFLLFQVPLSFFSTPKTQQDISQIASPAAAETLELFVPLASQCNSALHFSALQRPRMLDWSAAVVQLTRVQWGATA